MRVIMDAAPGQKAVVDIFAKNVAFLSLFRVKLDSRIF